MYTAKEDQNIAAREEELRKLLTTVMRRCPKKKRNQIAEEMSVRSGMRISKAMLDHWTDGSGVRFPALLVPIFCEVTDDGTLARYLLPERLRCALAIGEALLESPSALKQARIVRRKSYVLATKGKT